APRSGQTALHHAPVDWGHQTERIFVSRPSEAERQEELPAGDSATRLDLVPVPKPEAKGDVSEDRGYLDELQEAAAGLAKLMRSSPVSRPEPVVFEPETEAVPDESEDDLIEEPAAIEEIALELEAVVESATVEAIADIPEPVAAVVEMPEIADLAVAVADEPAEIIVPLTFRQRLGDEVADQLDRIDGSLAALELLVDGIQSSLMELRRIDLDETDAAIVTEEADHVAAAA
ncbi:MAG TPA: hypothetical protein PLA50_05010, partial [Bacteroidia bacterium]|nr:hypothetical protein [Bacteroidia bacterium]